MCVQTLDWSVMDVIIDFQCFKDNQDNIIPKEVAICAVDQDFIGHWITLPFCRPNELGQTIRQQNDWLTRNHHGIEWCDGDISVKKVYRNLEEVCRSVNRIYVRGQIKAELLGRITTRTIINLETDTDCPPFAKLPWSDSHCIRHALKPGHLRYSCALNNVKRVQLWLNTRKKLTSDQDLNIEIPANLCDEQLGNSEYSVSNSWSYYGGLCSRSDSPGVDETDSICLQHTEA